METASLPLLVGINHKEVAQHEARMKKSSSLTFTRWGPQFVNGKNRDVNGYLGKQKKHGNIWIIYFGFSLLIIIMVGFMVNIFRTSSWGL